MILEPTHTVRDRYGIYVFSDRQLLKVDITDARDKVWMLFHPMTDTWTWEISRYHIDKVCISELLADRDWVDTACLWPCWPMRERTLKSIVRKYQNMSKTSHYVLRILQAEIEKTYDYNYWYYADRFPHSNVLDLLERIRILP